MGIDLPGRRNREDSATVLSGAVGGSERALYSHFKPGERVLNALWTSDIIERMFGLRLKQKEGLF